MRRREFVMLLGGAAAAWPFAAQGSQQTRRVSVLVGVDEKDPEAQRRVKGFRLAMRDLGWVEGRNVQIEYRFAGSNVEAIKKHAAEVVGLAPDVIVASGTPVVAAFWATKTTIPIVIAMVSDPVGQGFISSLAHPGGNITGFTFTEPEVVGKWVNLLGDVKPKLSRVALMFNPDTAPYWDNYLRSFNASPKQSPVEVEAVHVRSAAEVELAIAKLGREPDSALVAASDVFIVGVRGVILKAADQHQVALISPYKQFVTEGSLMSYGPDTADIFRRSASYVDRILKGEAPGDLPTQAPVKFELVINLRTAKTLGLSPPELFRYSPTR